MATLKTEFKITEQNDNSQVRNIFIPTYLIDQGESQVQNTQIDDNSIVTPVTVTFAEFNTVNYLILYAVYRDSDEVLGIEAGDLAEIEVDLNGSGIFTKYNAPAVLPTEITSITFRKVNADTKVLKVYRVVNGKGI